MNIQAITNNISIAKFSGITKLFKQTLYQSPQAIDTFYNATKEAGKAIGSIPKDIIDFLPTINGSKKEAAKSFTKVMEIMGEELQQFEVKKLETAQNINIKNFIGTYLPKLAKVDIQPERISRIIAEMRKKLAPDKNIIQDFNQIMSDRITGLLKEQQLIKSSDNAKLTYLGQGVFKNAFKFEILDKEGKQIMHPKVLLSFKKDESILKQNNAIMGLINKYMTSMKRGEFINKVNGMVNSTPVKVIPENQRQLYKDTLLKMYDDIHNGKDLSKLKSLVETDKKYQAKYNGILAESNIIMFFKKAAGKPLAKTDFIDISYINPKNNIGLAEYSDDLLPKISKKVDLGKLGIMHDDLAKNKDNMVAERVIDYGNVKIVKERNSEILAKNPIARRYYNKFKQIKFKDENKTQTQRIEYWNNLYDKAINHKTPNHNDILKSLEICKTHISKENYTLLHDFKI